MKVFLFIMLTALLGLNGCAPRASSSMNASAGDITSGKTYAWLNADIQTNNPKYEGDIIDSKIRANVNDELHARGMSEVQENQNPDLWVAYHVFTENRQQITGGYYGGFYPGYGWGGYYGGWGYGGWGYYGAPSVYNYTEGTLILDFIDSKSKKVVWRGTIDGDVTNTRKLDKRIDKGVHAIMKEYPVPGPKHSS